MIGQSRLRETILSCDWISHALGLRQCQTCINSTKTSEKKNVIASNLLRMCKVPWIVVIFIFFSAVSESWLNKEFRWYQGSDPNVGSHGYLAVHQSICLYIQLRNLEAMK